MKDNRDTAHNKNEYFCSEWALHAIDYATDYRLMYKDEALNQKRNIIKFNPQRMYKYLKEQQLIDRKVENNGKIIFLIVVMVGKLKIQVHVQFGLKNMLGIEFCREYLTNLN